MRRLAAIAFASTLAATSAFAASSQPLAAGKPAGVKLAQRDEHNTMMLLVGVGIVGAGIALVASGSSRAPLTAPPVTTPTTTTTTTTTTTG